MRVNFPAAVALWLHFSSSATVCAARARTHAIPCCASHPPSLLASPPSIPHPNRTRPPQRENPPRITLPVVIRLASHSRQQIPSPSATHCHHHCHFAPSAHPRDTPLGTHRSERSASLTPALPSSRPGIPAHHSLASPRARSRPTPLRTHPTVTQPAVHSLVNHPRHPEHREMRGPGLVHGPPHVDGKIFHGYFRLSRGVSERVSERASERTPWSGSTGIPRIQRSPAPAHAGHRRRMIFVSRCQMLYTSESREAGRVSCFLFFAPEYAVGDAWSVFSFPAGNLSFILRRGFS